MPLGEVINVNSAQKAELERIVSDSMGITISLAQLRRVVNGANRLHFAILCADGPIIALKAVTRGVASGEEKEEVIARLGILLAAPNCCRLVLADSPRLIEDLRGIPHVALSIWLHPSKRLGDLDGAEIEQLRRSENLLRQVGEWVAFGVGFGVADRHRLNWVIDLPAERLSMIDNEDAFGATDPTIYREIVDFAVSDRNLLKTDKKSYADGRPVILGLETMIQKILTNNNAVQAILIEKQFSAGFRVPYTGMNPEQAADDIINRL